LDLVTRRHNWGEDRVYYNDEEKGVVSIPTRWTSVSEEDPFVVVAGGRCLFRVEDLLALARLIQGLSGEEGEK
jgi:hypothetical protein